MPERFLLQILRSLVAHHILESTRGVDGGYTLERPPEHISLLDVIEAIDGPLVASLPIGESLPLDSRNKLERTLGAVNSQMRRELAAVKLAHLLPKSAASSGSVSSGSWAKSSR